MAALILILATVVVGSYMLYDDIRYERTLKKWRQAVAKSDIILVSGDLPATGEANKIYRKTVNDSYSDYIWDGSDYVLLATYINRNRCLDN